MAAKIIGGIIPNEMQASTGGKLVSVFEGSVSVGQPPERVTQVTELTLDPTTTVASSPSIKAFHSTLFEDFNLIARSTYNFFTHDEKVNTDLPVSASLWDLPRYVTVSWDTVPLKETLTFSRKGLRPPDTRKPEMVPPVLKISDAKNSVANGYISPGVITTLLVPPVVKPPPPSLFHEDIFLSNNSAAGLSAHSSLDHPAFQSFTMPQPQTRVRVNFIDPSIAGAISDTRIAVSDDHTHLAALGAVAKLIPGLEIISEFNQDVQQINPVPDFPAPPASPTLLYVGYVLERHTMGDDGSMILSRTIDIDDITQGSFVDRQVVYNGRYSYRIRAVIQWTHTSVVDFTGKSTVDRIQTFNAANQGAKQASFYSGDWSDWARTEIIDDVPPDPPDEIYIRPISPKKQIDVVWKMPGDPQRDISSLRLVRAISRNGMIDDWTLLGEFTPSNGRYTDNNVEYVELSHSSYIYAMFSISFHGEISKLSDQFEVSLTTAYKYNGELPIRRIAPAGADPTIHASAKQTFGALHIVAEKSVSFYCRSGRSSIPLFQKNYIVEVQSLATGDRAEVDLVLKSTDIDVGTNSFSRRTFSFDGQPSNQLGRKA